MFKASLKINTPFQICLVGIVFVSLLSCHQSKPTSAEARLAFESVIPKPVSSTLTGNTFVLTNKTKVVTDSSGKEIFDLGSFLADKLNTATGFDIPVVAGDGDPGSKSIFLTTNGGDSQWGPEGYELSVAEDRIKITANTPAGLFWGIQTLRQIMPEKIEGPTVVQDGVWEIATGTILDYPEYAWRGSMLDVARHFFSVEDVKHYIDLISYYKNECAAPAPQ